ncbi:hypothetical protein CI109_106829 [Kwoniella shandongensis]|uniref:Tetrapyrrole biosynthesis uroporphyrinogen III synthase domain-containing protein n=1 Tax=Kwoniella shandongensis TaxID=1734106 RepID=A0A5M6CBD7_9TREE|nr:uncharacterized protein CI109_000915 [Kwoniella shandongensis]KAA5530735.1 hypothetical protein CI109_000915 [Kwoniella shandongensis]
MTSSSVPQPTFTPTLTPVILFKTPSSSSSSSDPYALALTPAAYTAHFVPVLTEEYESASLLELLRDGCEQWEGVVVTSKRGMEGWVKSVEAFLSLPDSVTSKGKGKRKATSIDEGTWSSLPLFSVGTTSIEYLNSTTIPTEYKPIPTQTQLDNPPKSATALAELILSTPPRSKQRGYRPYLFLCGDKTLEDLPKILSEGGREVREVRVYRTEGREDVSSNLEKVRQELEGGVVGWLGFWSPSSAGLVLPLLRQRDASLTETTNGGAEVESEQVDGKTEVVAKAAGALTGQWEGWKVFAIGETTRKFLEDEGVKVDAVADRPNPEGMVKALKTVDGDM